MQMHGLMEKGHALRKQRVPGEKMMPCCQHKGVHGWPHAQRGSNSVIALRACRASRFWGVPGKGCMSLHALRLRQAKEALPGCSCRAHAIGAMQKNGRYKMGCAKAIVRGQVRLASQRNKQYGTGHAHWAARPCKPQQCLAGCASVRDAGKR